MSFSHQKLPLIHAIFFSLAVLYSTGAPAQEPDATPVAEAEDVYGEAPTELRSGSTDIGEDQRTEIDELKERLAQAEDRIETLEFNNLQASSLGSTLDSQDASLSLHGFFDMTFTKILVDDTAMINGMINENSYFMVQHFNVYFFSQLSESFDFLSEIRFTFLPLGHDYGFEIPGISEYDREDTQVVDPQTSEHLHLGGLYIERIHLTWKPSDHFSVRAGHFLTPFGIWNVDHGSPVLITVRHPFAQIHRIMPLSQTGLQFFGRFFPSESFFIDYDVTVSNGRNPIAAIQDLDENKGVGLRLRFIYESNALHLALGGYGYHGDSTDIKKTLTFDPFKVVQTRLYHSTEWAGSADLLLEVYDFRLQSEFVRRYVVHEIHGERIPTLGRGLQPNFNSTDAYVLAGYTFSKAPWYLMPYGMVEYVDLDDSTPIGKGWVYVGGLNMKPKPFLVLKVEYNYADIPSAAMHVFSAQLAVAF